MHGGWSPSLDTLDDVRDLDRVMEVHHYYYYYYYYYYNYHYYLVLTPWTTCATSTHEPRRPCAAAGRCAAPTAVLSLPGRAACCAPATEK